MNKKVSLNEAIKILENDKSVQFIYGIDKEQLLFWLRKLNIICSLLNSGMVRTTLKYPQKEKSLYDKFINFIF